MNKKTAFIVVMCVLIFGIIYVNKNIGQIYASQGNYYFKTNNIQKAQEYYEKAFENNYYNTQIRDYYVNSIINSPLNITSQEKLVKFLQYPVEDLAKSKIEYFLYDLRREINRKYPENYIQQTTFNQKVVRWNTLPIKYGFKNNVKIPDYFEKEIEKAFSEWEQKTENIIYFEKDNKNPDIIISFEEKTFDESNTEKYVVAYTNPIIQEDLLKNFVITFYTKPNNQDYFSPKQIYNTALHEIAHALGFMGHSYNKKNIMHMSMESENSTTNQMTLTNADINTVKLLYTIKPDITNIEKPSGEYLASIVLGGKDGIVYAKTKEAKHYVNNAPHLSNGHIDLAENYLASKDYTKAIRSLEKALMLADTEELKYMTNYNLAIVYLKIDNSAIALDYAKEAKSLKDSEDINFILAEIYSRLGNNKESISLYKQLTKQNPKNIEYIICLTNIYIKQKDYLNARKILKQYLQLNPQERNNPRFEPYGILRFGL